MALGIDWNEPWGCSPLPSRAEKRQSATEPTIGNCEWGSPFSLVLLRGKADGWINALMSAVGYNFCKLLRAFACLVFFILGGVPDWLGETNWEL